MAKILCLNLICILLMWVAVPISAQERGEQMPDSMDILIDAFVVEAPSYKDFRPIRESAVAFSRFSMDQVNRSAISSVKDFSSSIPNFYQPDYGSQMTSSIYIRGLGARIDQPVMGLNVDKVPYMNKNNYDFDLFDVTRVEMLRGPQGTLYGRNTMCGVMNISTLSPLSYAGTRLSLDYSTANTVKLKASTYHSPSEKFGFSVAAAYHHTDGFFKNEFDGDKCDGSDAGALRARLVWKPVAQWEIDNALTIGGVSQGGYAYALYDTLAKKTSAVNYNDASSYDRFSLIDGLALNYQGSLAFTSITSYQYLDDEMNLDQDFTPKNIFTLTQAQKEHALTQEFVLKSKKEKNKVWQWQCGLWGFYKHIDMSAPVTFKRGGIEELILNNANAGIQSIFPDDYLDIQEPQFVVYSNFDMPTYGTAIYHQSEFEVGKWLFTLGVRLDYERAEMNYRNKADINYFFSLLMDDYQSLHTAMEGRETTHFVECLPKIAVQYKFNQTNMLYAYVAKGYKAGGFNTQIFSDILQNKMMDDMMSSLGIRFDGVGQASYNSAEATTYSPEYSWNYEVGGHHSAEWRENDEFQFDWSMFYIDCRDQQLTVFPAGKSTGRMMTNAGKTRSFGGECSLLYSPNNWAMSVAYGYTNAKFVDYNDGRADYSGNRVPYSPSNTVSAFVQRTIKLNTFVDKIVAKVDGKAVGDIYWNEANEYRQKLYCLMGGEVSFHHKKMELSFWGKNLTDTNYDTFYFRSVGRDFFQTNKPRQIGLSFKGEF